MARKRLLRMAVGGWGVFLGCGARPGACLFCRHTEEEAVTRVRGRKWGNSLALGIPRPFAGDADVSAGTEVDLVASEGRRVATPVKRASAIFAAASLAGHPGHPAW